MLTAGFIMMVAWGLLAAWLLRRGSLPGMPEQVDKSTLRLALGLMGTVLVAKMIVGALYRGYPADVGTFSAWALDMAARGPAHFYQPGYFADYPPGYLYVLGAIGGLSRLLHVDAGSPGFLILLKLPPMLADLGLAWLVTRVALRQGSRLALAAGLLLLLSPLAIVDSSLWGQVDSVFTLVLMGCLYFLEEARWELAAALYALAVLLKPQALVAGPVALAALIECRDWKRILQALAAFAAAGLVLVLPFAWGKPPLWIFELFSSTLGSYNYLALNAFNLPALLGGNWLATSTEVLGLEVGTWAWLSFLPVLGYLGWLLVKGKGRARFVFGAAAIYLAFFVLAPKMHERYLYPAAFLAFLAASMSGDRRLGWIGAVLTLTSFWNVLETLDLMVRANSVVIPSGEAGMVLGSLVNLGLLAWTLRVGHQVFLQGKVQVEAAPEVESEPITVEVVPMELSKRPGKPILLTLGLLILAYAGLTFWNLGSRRGPQTVWKTPGEAVFDLGSERTVDSLDYFHGLGTGTYGVSLSRDGQTWTSEASLANDNGFAELRWRNLALHQSGRYLRIHPLKGNLELVELHLNPEGTAPRLVSGNGAEALFDEPSTFAPGKSFRDGMYFDEIYHARSGWEISRGIDATETTHPPLGKVIIAGGIRLFGMNPFGYRFFGALTGVLMLPLLFMLARRLTRRDDLALVATLLFALDFMHFAQTRIATIDSFPVLFILGAYAFLLAYLQTPPVEDQHRRAALNLWICGAFIGLAMASKWIGIYAASGLLAIFAVDLFHRPRAWAFRHSLMALGAFGLLPTLIYGLSYLPFLRIPGRSLGDILTAQQSMWSYHAHLNSTHPFSSFWYEWPLMTKPIWYFSDSAVAKGTISSIEAFGNPVVWYLGCLAFLVVLGRYGQGLWLWLKVALNQPTPPKKTKKPIKKKARPSASPAKAWAWTPMRTWSFLLLGGLAQYFPWVVIPRKLAFIYHFFATVPFLILALVLELGLLQQWKPESKLLRMLPWLLVGAALVCFIACYPVLSGAVVSRTWGEAIQRVFHGIYF